jgi:hypothetical protein
MRADVYRTVSALICAHPRLILFLVLSILPICVPAQTTLDDLRNKLAVGSTEEKRSALFEIRTLHTEQASRIAVPALSDTVDIVRATAASSVIFLPRDEAPINPPIAERWPEFVRRETAFARRAWDPAAGTADRESEKENSIENVWRLHPVQLTRSNRLNFGAGRITRFRSRSRRRSIGEIGRSAIWQTSTNHPAKFRLKIQGAR